MHPSATGHLRELCGLADELFEIVGDEFSPREPLRVEFHQVDDLVGWQVEERHLVAVALLCAQLLYRVTAEPDHAQPRLVQTLTDIVEQVIPHLARARPGMSPAVESDLRTLGDRFASTASELILLADPGAAAYDVRDG